MNVLIAVLLLLCALAVLLSMTRVPEGQAYTVYRFGAYRRTLDAGMHWILPMIERVAHRISLTGRALSLGRRQVSLRDGVSQELHGRVYFQVLDVKRADAEFDHLDELVLDAIEAQLTAAADSCDSVATLNLSLKMALNTQLREHGIVITRCQLAN
jgi:regulator of protease activity HflC (stomatin/prohibitin superfamily)